MKIASKIINFFNNLINKLIVIFFVIAILFSSYAIFDAFKVYGSGNLSNELLALKPRGSASLQELQKINPDICGWITIDNTHIDYPVVIGKDNDEYLNKDYKKDFATAGSLFLDYRNDRFFKNDYSIIYGHNMKASQMFSDIRKFENKAFFEKNEYGTLYTEQETYKIDIFCLKNVSAYSSQTFNLTAVKDDNNKSLISFFSKDTINIRDMDISEEDKLLLLSTCDVVSENTRVVLVAKLIELDEDVEKIDITEDVGRIITKEGN